MSVEKRMLLPRRLELENGYQGPQVVIKWSEPEKPELVDRYRLVRQLFSYPASINDGVVVTETTTTDEYVFNDLEVDAGDVYYYRLFGYSIGDDRWVTETRVRNHIVVEDSFGMGDRVFRDMLPDVYSSQDNFLVGSDDTGRRLKLGKDEDKGDLFNVTD